MNEKSIGEVLADVAAAVERTKDDPPGERHRNRARRDPAQVYSIRIPVDHLEDIRRLAAQRGVQPTAMLRSWVLERLDAERHPSRSQVTIQVRRQAFSGAGRIPWADLSGGFGAVLTAGLVGAIDESTY